MTETLRRIAESDVFLTVLDQKITETIRKTRNPVQSFKLNGISGLL